MAARPVRFELHIVPLIRAMDRDKMLFRMDLLSYDDFKTNVDAILARTPIDMPPTAFGGPWPTEWVALVERWKDEGFLRLELAAPDANGYRVTRSGDRITVACRGSVPTSGYRVWLDTETTDFFAPRTLILYAEPPATPQPPTPMNFRATISFVLAAGMTEIQVRDTNGTQTLAIPPLAPTPVPPAMLTTNASLPDATRMLHELGAQMTAESPTVSGSMQTYTYKGQKLELFHDGQSLELELSPHIQSESVTELERKLDSLSSSRSKK